MSKLKKITTSLFLGVVLVFSIDPAILINANQANLYQNFRKIKLFDSSQSDVEKLFRYTEKKETYISDGSKTIYYTSENARLAIDYSVGSCSERKSSEGYDVKNGIVIGAYIYFFNPISISELSVNLDNFEMERNSETQSITYKNQDQGIEISGSDKEVMSIEISPSASQEKKFRCDINHPMPNFIFSLYL